MSTIANQAWEIVNQTNVSSQQAQKGDKKGEALIAQANRAKSLKQLEKDVILVSEVETGQAPTPTTGAKPRLPTPGFNWKAFEGSEENQPGLIAIMGAVLALQAKTNSTFWSLVWNQATTSMMTQVKFAPIIGDAIKAQYNAQSLATQAQADQSWWDGAINLGGFAMAMVGGFISQWKAEDPIDEIDDAKPKIVQDEIDDPLGNSPETEQLQEVNENNEPIDENGDVIEENQEQNIDKNIQKTDSNLERAKQTLAKVGSGAKKTMKFLTGFLGKGMQHAMGMQMLTQGITGFFIDSKYQSKISIFQGEQGQADALSQEAQSYAQFYGQDYQRMEELRQGSGQQIDSAMNILQQAANTITQTVTSMFRG